VENSSGYDIVFTDAVGTPLNHEVEDYDPGSGTLVAWVYVPALSTSVDTVIYMVYGDSGVSAPTETPSAVWDGNYQAVWHLNQAPTNSAGEILDSTANTNHGRSKNMADGDTTPGRIGDGLDFNGINAQLDMGSDPSLDNLQYMTFTAWIKQTGIGDNPRTIFEKRAQTGESRNLYIITANRVRYIQQTDASNVNRLSTLVVSDNVWYHVALTWDGSLNSSGINFYINGLLANYGAGSNGSGTPLDDSGGNFWIGNRHTTSKTFMGVIDEVRVSDITRDACWIETEYNNQSSPHTFHVIGDEELVNGTTWEITATSGANGSIFEAGSVTVNEGGSQNFLLVADQDYEVDTLAIDGGAAQAYGSASYQFTNVTADTSIHVTFKLAPVGPTVDVDVVPPGCSENIAADYSTGFDPDNLDLLNCDIDDDDYVTLNTGNWVIDPNSIVLPFRQQVAVTLLYEKGNNQASDFGWLLASDDRFANPAPTQKFIKTSTTTTTTAGWMSAATALFPVSATATTTGFSMSGTTAKSWAPSMPAPSWSFTSNSTTNYIERMNQIR
jgi:hypothetical protein